LPEDCADIFALDRTLWGNWSYGSPFTRQLTDMGHPVFVARDVSGALAGYCIGLTQADCVTGYILDVTTHPHYRRQGAAAGLVSAVVEDFRNRNMKAVNAAIDGKNEASKRLFAGLGFWEAKQMKNYYETGDLHCLFRLEL
jgi:ribosomal protein S18 acetylase RimI-like enzyme